MLTTWLLTLAHAGCPPLALDGTLPATGTGNVPYDQPLMVVAPDGPCSSALALILVGPGGSPTNLPTNRQRLGATWVYRSLPTLVPDTTYQLVVTDGSSQQVIPFVTGDSPYEAPLLDLSITDTQLGDSDGLTATVVVEANTSAGNLLHYSGSMAPGDPHQAILSRGGSETTLVTAQIVDGIACAAVRAEAPLGDRTPWVQACELIDPAVDTGPRYEWVDTGTPPVETGYYDEYEWEDYDRYYDGNNDDFVLFACGGCQSAARPPAALLLPLVLLGLRRRRA